MNEKADWKMKYIIICMVLITAFAIYGTEIPPKMEIAQTIKIGENSIDIEIQKTKAELEKGLSGREFISENSGMLFVFPTASKYSFWMPDMKFPIDIIWIKDNKIVDITKNVSNIFDKENPTYYSPNVPANYVLEVNAGFSDKKNIKIGDTVNLNP